MKSSFPANFSRFSIMDSIGPANFSLSTDHSISIEESITWLYESIKSKLDMDIVIGTLPALFKALITLEIHASPSISINALSIFILDDLPPARSKDLN